MEKYDLQKHGVTQGLLSTFMRCREETRRWLQGLEPMRTTSGLQFGTIAHIVLEKIYSRKVQSVPTREEIFKALKYAEDCYLKERGGRVGAEEQSYLEENMAILEIVLPRYFAYYKKDFGTVQWVELEQKFRVPSPVEGADLVGRIDGAYKVNKKELWLMDHKTKSRIEEDVMSDTLTFDFQLMTYTYALEKKYSVLPKGAIYNIIRRPGERQGKKETWQQFRNRLDGKIGLEPDHYFMRYEVCFSKPDYERFKKNLTSVIKEFQAWLRGEMDTYLNTSSCIQRWGPCKFLPLCAQGERGLYNQRKELFPELVR